MRTTHIRVFSNLDRCAITYDPEVELAMAWLRLTDWPAIESEHQDWMISVFYALRTPMDPDQSRRLEELWRQAVLRFNDPLS